MHALLECCSSTDASQLAHACAVFANSLSSLHQLSQISILTACHLSHGGQSRLTRVLSNTMCLVIQCKTCTSPGNRYLVLLCHLSTAMLVCLPLNWCGAMSNGCAGTNSSALPVMQGDTSLPAVVQWLHLMAASPSNHDAQPNQRISKRRRQPKTHNKQQQQPKDELHTHPTVISMHSTQALPDSLQQPNQHSFQQLLMSDEPIEQPIEPLIGQPIEQPIGQSPDISDARWLHQHSPAALAKQGSVTAAVLASAAPSAAAAGGAVQDSQGTSPCGWSRQHEWAYMDCLSQLREAMFADLPPPVPAEVPLLDHGSGKAIKSMPAKARYV